jgi:Zn-dependent peptidase ImmA (M78 family)
MTRREHAQRIIRALSPQLRDALRRAPVTAMTDEGLTVRAVALSSERGAGGMCDGMSFRNPNVVLYARTSSRRENFTLLHEYAHLLVARDSEAAIWLADQDEPLLELERLCDDIAGSLLIPEEVLNEIVRAGPVTGQHLLDLFHRTEASQVACAIALSRRLTCTGAIMLTDRQTNTVVYAALVDEPSVYPTRKQALPGDHPLAKIVSGQHIRRESFWATPWGTRSPYYLDATATERRTYSVLAELDLWGISHLHLNVPEPAAPTRPSASVRCPCGFHGNVTGFPCSDCGKPFCPRCQRCDCERRAALTVRCEKCTVSVPIRDIENGLCSNCR